MRPVKRSWAGPFRSTSTLSTSDREPRLRTERLWQQYFADPSQWWDNRINKSNPEAPDLRHKSTQKMLWMDGCYNPSWVKEILEEKEAEKWGHQVIHKVKSSAGCAKQGHTCSNSDPGLAEQLAHMCTNMDASNEQQLRNSSTWKTMDLMAQLPSIDNLICILEKCREKGDLAYAKRVHAYICNNGLECHRAVGDHIVPMFVECGSVSDAQQVFDRLVYRSEHSWTSLILGYVECGQWEYALNLYEKMQEDCVHPNSYTVMALLKACARLKDVERGREIHVNITQNGFQKYVFVGNTLVDMYAKCGSMSEALEVFDNLPVRNVVSWNTLITGYAEHGPYQEALKCFKQMQMEGISPDAVTFLCALKASGIIGAIEMGREIHSDLTQKGFEREAFVGNTLVDMYAKCGSIAEAQSVFNKLPVRDVVSWTALIAGHADHGPGLEALECFEQMQLEGLSPNTVTFCCALKACGSIGTLEKGREIHNDVLEKGLERDVFVGSALVDMYAKCGSLAKAQEVFDKLPVRNVVSWTALIAGYADHGPGEQALKCFELMKLEGIAPNAVTYVCVLKACGSIKAIDKGREIHTEVTQEGFEGDVLVGSTLVDMYAKCGSLAEAQEIFNNLPVRDDVSWNALIAGYAEHGPGQEALNCFERMQMEGITPDDVTYVSIFKACGNIGAKDKGREIHTDIAQKGFEIDLCVGNSLIDMHTKCGSIVEAQEVFDKLPVRDVVSWNALIKGHAMNHDGNMAVKCFVDMQEQGIKPDAITFTCLLTACSRSRLALKGQEFFSMMKVKYGIAPTIDHYTCMVDLLAQSGCLYEAENFLEIMPCPPLWMALLSACKIYGEAELGLRCFQQLVQMNPECATPYVLMAKIYASAGRWDDVYRIEELRKHAGAKKKAACALIEVNKKVHEFVVGNNQSKEITEMLEILSSRVKGEGHVPNVNLDLRPISDEEKEAALCEHAEKMAIAFGLLNTPQGQTLRVTKNLRMCNDCHSTIQIISRIERREIIVREVYHVHHFKDGLCSCSDMS